MFVGKVRHEDRLLREENQAGRGLIDGLLMAAHELSRHICLNGIEAHMLRSGSCSERTTKFTCTTRGRR